MDYCDDVPGYSEFVAWCAGWPSFHDAEIVRLELDRTAPSKLVIFVWGGIKPTFGPRSDRRYSCPPSNVIVTFTLEGIEDLELADFSHQNVIFGLAIERKTDVFEIDMHPCFGLAGKIAARRISIGFESQP